MTVRIYVKVRKKEVVDAKSTPTEAAKSIVDALLPKQP